MFLTKQAHRSDQSELMNANESLWQELQVVFQEPWFVVTVAHADSTFVDEATVVNQTLLVSNIANLERLKIDCANPLTKIKDVYVVLPAHMNQSDGWTMERLSKVWSSELPDEIVPSAQIFESINGTVYCHPKFRTLLQDVRNGPPLFSF